MNDEIITDSVGDSELRQELIDRFKYSKEHYSEWEKQAQEDYAFALGDQWDDEDQQSLKEQGRPCLTFNRIRPMLSLISGYQRENAARIKVNPEGGEDRVFSEVLDKALHAIDKWSHLSYKLGYLFDDGIYCGKGFVEATLDYSNDPVRGELKFINTTPYQILVDPDCTEYDLNSGAEFTFKVVRLTKDKLKVLYPKKKKTIDGFKEDTDDWLNNASVEIDDNPDDDYGSAAVTRKGGTPDRDEEESDAEGDEKFTLKEYWRKKYVKRYFVIDIDNGEPKKFEKIEEAESFSKKQGAGMKVIERTVPEMWVASMVCGFILQDEISTLEPYYSGFPFFRFIADWSPNASSEELRVQGITRGLKDPQKEKNKSKSQYLHILNTQANSGWIGDEGALTKNGWDDLKTIGAKPGIVIKKKQGFELREILPKGPNIGHLQREEKADEEFKQISGINPDLMGFQEGTSSGKAISMRIKQAILALVRIFYNYKYTKEIIGKFILQMTPVLFDTTKLSKILGPDYMMKAIDPMKYPGGLSEGHLKAFLTMISDNKYDVIVTEADQNSTLRYETFTQLVELVKAGLPIPPDLVIEYLDIPNQEEVKQRMLQMQQQQQQQQQQDAMMKMASKQKPANVPQKQGR